MADDVAPEQAQTRPDDGRPSRRRVLAWGATAAGTALAAACSDNGHSPQTPKTPGAAVPTDPAPTAPTAQVAVPPGVRLWSDAKGWGGNLPGETTHVRIEDGVVLDIDVSVASVEIVAGGSVTYAPGRSVSLSAQGNVIVRGDLVLVPGSAAVQHQLRLTGAVEEKFAGGAFAESDVGVWVSDAGRLHVAGTPKTAWGRLADDAPAGSREIVLAQDPVGWRVDDEIAVTPTTSPRSDSFQVAYDVRTVAAVSGRRIRLTEPLAFDHPITALGAGVVAGAEVLNLTRNVRIEGRPDGRAHVHIMSSQRQQIGHAAIRWMGPRKQTDETYSGDAGVTNVTETILARYALHFHMMHEASRGSIVDGVVVRDCGSHAFVPHESHGITFRNCISHNTWDDAFWWDGAPDTRDGQGPSHDLLWESSVASLVAFDPPFRGYRLAGFSLGAGNGSAIRDCVAVGIGGSTNASGFKWDEGGIGDWAFERCVAHNNAANGAFVWQNTADRMGASSLVAYHNGGFGIDHGAYNSDFEYRDSILYGNGEAGVRLHSLGFHRGTSFTGLLIDGAGISDFAFTTAPHVADGAPVKVMQSKMVGYRRAGVGFLSADGSPERIDILDCTFSGNELWLDDDVAEPVQIRFRSASRGSVAVMAAGDVGKATPEWNAVTTPVDLGPRSGAYRPPAITLLPASPGPVAIAAFQPRSAPAPAGTSHVHPTPRRS